MTRKAMMAAAEQTDAPNNPPPYGNTTLGEPPLWENAWEQVYLPGLMPEKIAKAILAVKKKVTHVDKLGENQFHNYKFVAVNDLLAQLQPAMAEAGLIVVQSEVSHDWTAGNQVMEANYEFTLAHESGETWGYKPRHTGMATARNSKGGVDDKALNKCHTAARKYFLLSLFQIPSQAIPDADGTEDAPAHESSQRGRADRQQTTSRQQTNRQPPSRQAAPSKTPHKLALEIPDGDAPQVYERAGEWLDAFQREFEAYDDVSAKSRFFDANLPMFQTLQAAANKQSNRQAADRFADVAEHCFNVLNSPDGDDSEIPY